MRCIVAVNMLAVIVLSVSAAEGQDGAANPGAEPGPVRLFLRTGGESFSLQQPPPQQPATQPPPALLPRRRWSTVGYLEDTLIESKLRVRFDAAFQNTVPDRAEFFYAKCGCYRDLDPADPAFDPDAPGPRPGAASDLRFQELYLSGEYAFTPILSAFGELPVRWLQPQRFLPGTGPGFANQVGIGDIRGGVRLGLLADDDRRVTSQVRVFLPTGDASQGLGTHHASIEPAVLYYQAATARVAVESQAGVWLPLSGADPVTQTEGRFAGNVFFYGIGPSVAVYSTDRLRVTPVVELVGWRVLDGNQTAGVADAGGTNIVNLKIGARTTVRRGSFYVGYGFALTDQVWYEDVLRFEYRHGF